MRWVIVLLLAGMTLRSAAARGQASADATSISIHKVAGKLYVIDGTSNGDKDVPNVAVYVTEQGVALVDPWFAEDYSRILAAVRSVTTQPVRYVFNTHYHSDHTGDNRNFQPDTIVVSHANARRSMEQRGMPGLPQIAVSGPASFYLGDDEIRVFPMGAGHTDGDLAVVFPGAQAVCMGDMMAGTRGVTNPVVDYSAGGSLLAWPASLDRVLRLHPAVVIPGHGALTNEAGLLAHRNKVELVGVRLRQWVAGVHTSDQVRASLIEEFDFKPINLRALDRLISEAAAANHEAPQANPQEQR